MQSDALRTMFVFLDFTTFAIEFIGESIECFSFLCVQPPLPSSCPLFPSLKDQPTCRRSQSPAGFIYEGQFPSSLTHVFTCCLLSSLHVSDHRSARLGLLTLSAWFCPSFKYFWSRKMLDSMLSCHEKDPFVMIYYNYYLKFIFVDTEFFYWHYNQQRLGKNAKEKEGNWRRWICMGYRYFILRTLSDTGLFFGGNVGHLSWSPSVAVYLMHSSSWFTAILTPARYNLHNKRTAEPLRGIEWWRAGSFSRQLPSRWPHITQHVLPAKFLAMCEMDLY